MKYRLNSRRISLVASASFLFLISIFAFSQWLHAFLLANRFDSPEAVSTIAVVDRLGEGYGHVNDHGLMYPVFYHYSAPDGIHYQVRQINELVARYIHPGCAFPLKFLRTEPERTMVDSLDNISPRQLARRILILMSATATASLALFFMAFRSSDAFLDKFKPRGPLPQSA